MGIFDKLYGRFSGRNELATDSENYIENKNEALQIICMHMSRYAGSRDRNLTVLELIIVTPRSDAEVNWADDQFKNELKIRLHQDMVVAVNYIRINYISSGEIKTITVQYPLAQPMVENRLYYYTHSVDAPNPIWLPEVAWLVSMGDRQSVKEPIYELDPKVKTIWNIGRTEQPTIIDLNDIVIAKDCNGISRQHAAIVVEDGHYYVKCKIGGCRARGGNGVTKIIRAANGRVEELETLSVHATKYLNNGDLIQLSRTVYLKFVTDKPPADA